MTLQNATSVCMHFDDFSQYSELCIFKWFFSNVFKVLVTLDNDKCPWRICEISDIGEMSFFNSIDEKKFLPSNDSKFVLHPTTSVSLTFSSYHILISLDIGSSVFAVNDIGLPLHDILDSTRVVIDFLLHNPSHFTHSIYVSILLQRAEGHEAICAWQGDLASITNVNEFMEFIRSSVVDYELKIHDIQGDRDAPTEYPTLCSWMDGIIFYLETDNTRKKCPIVIFITTSVIQTHVTSDIQLLAKYRISLHVIAVDLKLLNPVGMLPDHIGLQVIAESSGGSFSISIGSKKCVDEKYVYSVFRHIFRKRFLPGLRYKQSDGTTTRSSPLQRAISLTASDQCGQITGFSNRYKKKFVSYIIEGSVLGHLLAARMREGFLVTHVVHRRRSLPGSVPCGLGHKSEESRSRADDSPSPIDQAPRRYSPSPALGQHYLCLRLERMFSVFHVLVYELTFRVRDDVATQSIALDAYADFTTNNCVTVSMSCQSTKEINTSDCDATSTESALPLGITLWYRTTHLLDDQIAKLTSKDYLSNNFPATFRQSKPRNMKDEQNNTFLNFKTVKNSQAYAYLHILRSMCARQYAAQQSLFIFSSSKSSVDRCFLKSIPRLDRDLYLQLRTALPSMDIHFVGFCHWILCTGVCEIALVDLIQKSNSFVEITIHYLGVSESAELSRSVDELLCQLCNLLRVHQIKALVLPRSFVKRLLLPSSRWYPIAKDYLKVIKKTVVNEMPNPMLNKFLLTELQTIKMSFGFEECIGEDVDYSGCYCCVILDEDARHRLLQARIATIDSVTSNGVLCLEYYSEPNYLSGEEICARVAARDLRLPGPNGFKISNAIEDVVGTLFALDDRIIRYYTTMSDLRELFDAASCTLLAPGDDSDIRHELAAPEESERRASIATVGSNSSFVRERLSSSESKLESSVRNKNMFVPSAIFVANKAPPPVVSAQDWDALKGHGSKETLKLPCFSSDSNEILNRMLGDSLSKNMECSDLRAVNIADGASTLNYRVYCADSSIVLAECDLLSFLVPPSCIPSDLKENQISDSSDGSQPSKNCSASLSIDFWHLQLPLLRYNMDESKLPSLSLRILSYCPPLCIRSDSKQLLLGDFKNTPVKDLQKRVSKINEADFNIYLLHIIDYFLH